MPGTADLASSTETWQEKLKEYGERVAKYIPAEVVAFYTGATQLILMKQGDPNRHFRVCWFLAIGIVAWIGTWFLLGSYSKDPKTRLPNQIIGTIAFGIWVYSYPAGWYKEMSLYDPVVGGLLLLFFTFGIAFYTPRT